MTKWKVGDKLLWKRRVKTRQPHLMRNDPQRYALETQTPVPVIVESTGERATDDAGPGSGGGSKIRVRRTDTKETTYVYARNLMRRP